MAYFISLTIRALTFGFLQSIGNYEYALACFFPLPRGAFSLVIEFYWAQSGFKTITYHFLLFGNSPFVFTFFTAMPKVKSTYQVQVSGRKFKVKHNLLHKLNSTGKSLSEALLFAEHGENMLCTEIVLNVKNNFCIQHAKAKEKQHIITHNPLQNHWK